MADTNLKTASLASSWRAAIAINQEPIFDYLLDNIYAIVIIGVALLSFVVYGFHRCCRRLCNRRNNKIYDEQGSKDKKSTTVALKKADRRDYILDHLRTRKMKRTSLNMIGGGGGGSGGSTIKPGGNGNGDTQRKRRSSLILELDKEATSDEPSLSIQSSSLDEDIQSFDSKPFEIANRSESADERSSSGSGILQSLGAFATSLFRRHQDIDDDDSDESGRQLTRCHICLCDFDVGEDICYSRNDLCRHNFHKECIVEWLLDHDRCPCCHRDFQLSSDDTTAATGVGGATTMTKASSGRAGSLTVAQDSGDGDEQSVDSDGAVRPAIKVPMRNVQEKQQRRSSLVDVGF